MTILIATMTMAGETFDVEVISEFRGMSEVNAIDCHPFLHGASYAIVKSDDLTNRRVDTLPDDLPTFEPPLDVTDEMDAEQTRRYLQSVYEGGA